MLSFYIYIIVIVIIILQNSILVFSSPSSQIKAIPLPSGEKAISVACLDNSIVSLSSNGKVFSSPVDKGESLLRFSAVEELAGQEIVCVSGTYTHCLAVSKEGHVFGCGSNSSGQLGFDEGINSVSSFKLISSLGENKIKAVYAGYGNSLFETHEGKILSYWYNNYGELLLGDISSQNVYIPTEIKNIESVAFCIAGGNLSVIFIGGSPPPNTPNRMINHYE